MLELTSLTPPRQARAHFLSITQIGTIVEAAEAALADLSGLVVEAELNSLTAVSELGSLEAISDLTVITADTQLGNLEGIGALCND